MSRSNLRRDSRRTAVRLTVQCPCGTSTSVAAGDEVTCSCGRRFDTAELPDHDVRGLQRLVARSKRNRLVFLVTMAFVVLGLLIVGRSAPLPVTVAVFGLAWWRFCRPWWRRRRAGPVAGELPRWQLSAKGGVVS